MSSENFNAPGIPAPLSRELYAKSQASDYGLTEPEFSTILGSVLAKSEAAKNSSNRHTYPEGLADFLRNLKLEELALARGCAAGSEYAWEVFLTRYRAKLYEAARYITKEDVSAHDLADSIYGDLYGTGERDGERISKLASYMGRGSLEGWLRTVLAQEWINRYRKNKKLISLEGETERGTQFAAEQPAATSPAIVAGGQQDLTAATDAALTALSGEDRYILASYYLDQRTLADVARVLGVHESTISRKVEKLATTVRKNILAHLMRGGMSRRQAEEALEVDVRDVTLDLRSRLAQAAPSNLARTNLSEITGSGVQDSPGESFSEKSGG